MNLDAVVLNAEGLSAWIRRDRGVMAVIQELHDMEADLVISANTIVEVTHATVDRSRLNWLLSQVRVEPVTGQFGESGSQAADRREASRA